MMARRWLAALALSAVGSCGDATAQELPAVIRFSMLTDMGGAYTANSGPGGLAAARLAIEDFGGTLVGRTVEVVGADDQNADVASSVERAWLDQGAVSAIFDGRQLGHGRGNPDDHGGASPGASHQRPGVAELHQRFLHARGNPVHLARLRPR